MNNDTSLWNSIKENLPATIAIIGMVATLGNLWLISSVAPLSTQINEVRAQVGTIEKTIDLTSDSRDRQQESLEQRLDRIENKLDQLIQSR